MEDALNLGIKILAFKVIQSHWIRWQSRPSVGYDFLLVINSNLGAISHRYWDTATYWLRIAIFSTPSHLTPSFGMTPFEFMEKLYGFWNYRVFQAANGKNLVILACAVFDWSTRVTDR